MSTQNLIDVSAVTQPQISLMHYAVYNRDNQITMLDVILRISWNCLSASNQIKQHPITHLLLLVQYTATNQINEAQPAAGKNQTLAFLIHAFPLIEIALLIAYGPFIQ